MDSKRLRIPLWLLVTVFIVLVLGQVTYYFYTNNMLGDLVQTFNPASIEHPKLSNRNEILRILSLNHKRLQFTDITPYLTEGEVEPCTITKGCFELYNWREDTWYSNLNKRRPLPAIQNDQNFLVIGLNIRSIYGPGGILLMPDEWFIESYETQNLFISVSDENSRLIIEAKSDETGQKYVLSDETKEKDFFTHLYLVIDKQGKYIALSDKNFSRLSRYIDVNMVTGDAFPRGIFPNGQIYLGYKAAPNSYIYIPKIEFSPL